MKLLTIQSIKEFFESFYLRNSLLGNSLERWFQCLALGVALWLLLCLFRSMLCRHLANHAKKTGNKTYDALSQVLKKTKAVFLLAAAFDLTLRPLHLPSGIEKVLDKVLVFIVVVQVGIWGTLLLKLWVEPLLIRKLNLGGRENSKVTAFLFIFRVIFFSLLVIWGLDNLGINVSALVTGLGIGGVAVALATQNILGDLFASMSISLDQPFRVGDNITIDTFSGKIEKIGLKTTRIRSATGEQLVFSNADLLGSRIRNMERMQERQVTVRIGVTYGTPTEKLRAIPDMLHKAVLSTPKTRSQRAHLISLSASSIDFELVFWIESKDHTLYLDSQQKILLEILKKFEDAKIEIAYPTQTLFVNTTTEASGAPRPV